MHAKTDSEVTSLATSSPNRSPRRPDILRAKPIEGFPRWGEDRDFVSFYAGAQPSGVSSPFSLLCWGGHRKGQKPWKDCDVIEEEGLLDDEERGKSLPRRCYFLIFVLGFVVLFSLFGLILWGASRPMKPKITMKSIKFEHVQIQAGSDSTGVATDMISMNSTVKLTYRNTGTFFGVHVASTPLDLSYSEITVASGTIKKFYQSRKSQRTISVPVMGNRIPLYGSGASLSTVSGMITVPVTLKLNFVIRSRAYVLGKLVKPKFYKKIECSITLDPKKLKVAVPLKKSCSYD
ncbi:Late embryogenesis abundant protein [Quillaja saponaria]|uniref:Late embryogenesis abundant protein n=1 Tax=Quillaja saponaria TaxID=32244 RepID=A0AAD7LHW2_QUISA|nr:Late embryogenesis abundant protein [Quillaja saponaria]